MKFQIRICCLCLVTMLFLTNAYAKDEKSSVIASGTNQIHVNYVASQTSAQDSPAVILLSGPNQHWHSDSAWFALTQSHLSSAYRSYAIDRAGQGLSSANGTLSYRQFADDLFNVLSQLDEPKFVIVAFASANISLALFEAKYGSAFDIQGILLVDPDVITPETIAFYKDYPASWYQKNIEKITAHIEKGKWTERSQGKNEIEVEQINTLIAPAYQKHMNWDYFYKIAGARLTITGQVSRAKSIANYAEDLDRVANLPMISDIKVSVINSDFELHDLPDKPAQVAKIKRWHQVGDDWSQKVAKVSGGQYIALPNSSHLVMFEHPEVIRQAIDNLIDSPSPKL